MRFAQPQVRLLAKLGISREDGYLGGISGLLLISAWADLTSVCDHFSWRKLEVDPMRYEQSEGRGGCTHD
jgi:hypothetical protein